MTTNDALGATAAYPIRLTVTDDLARTRLTVALRILIVIPHLVWLTILAMAAYVLWFVDWIWTLAAGQSPEWAHRFFALLLRISVQVSAFLFLAADPYPPFLGEPGYPVDLEVDAAAPQRRVVTLFRPILAIPMLIVASVLHYVLEAVAIIAWCFILFTGTMHEGMRNVITFCIAFTTRTYGYLAFLTDRYPPLSEGKIPTS